MYHSQSSVFPTAEPCGSLLETDETLNSAFLWPQTEYGETTHLQCPCDAFPELTKDAFASRTCGAGGQWMDTNVAACTFDNRDSYCQVTIRFRRILVHYKTCKCVHKHYDIVMLTFCILHSAGRCRGVVNLCWSGIQLDCS